MENFKNLTKEQLIDLYKWQSTRKIAKKYGVCDETVRKRFIKLGIPRRSTGIQREFDPPAKELGDLYQQISMREIAKRFGVGETVVWKRLKEHGIKLRDYEGGGHRLKPGRVFSEQHRKNIGLSMRGKYGPKNRNWKGGKHIATLRARWTVEYREWRKSALTLRGSKCQECGAANGYMCDCCGTKVTLHVHHIESFARVPERRIDPTNSEVLCPRCHHKRHRRKPRELLETPNDNDEGNQQPSAAGMR